MGFHAILTELKESKVQVSQETQLILVMTSVALKSPSCTPQSSFDSTSVSLPHPSPKECIAMEQERATYRM
jgi:hypothetical protein